MSVENQREENRSMAEEPKINQMSVSRSTEKPPITARNSLPKCTPRKFPTQTNRKITQRSQTNLDIHDSPYFKIRSLVQELRRHFLEVLHAPDFQNCNGAHEIKMQPSFNFNGNGCAVFKAITKFHEMKLLMGLYKQMTKKAVPTVKLKNFPEHQPSSATILQGKETRHPGRPLNQSKPHPLQQIPAFGKRPQPPHFSNSGSPLKGSYVVGGSPLGLNFLIFRGGKPVYYGVTKEMHRDFLAQKKVAS